MAKIREEAFGDRASSHSHYHRRSVHDAMLQDHDVSGKSIGINSEEKHGKTITMNQVTEDEWLQFRRGELHKGDCVSHTPNDNTSVPRISLSRNQFRPNSAMSM